MNVFDPRPDRPMRIAVLISGTGRTLRNMLRRIETGELSAAVCLVISSTPNARGLQYAEKSSIPLDVIEREDSPTREAFSRAIFDRVRPAEADLVALGGFVKWLWVPPDFANRVVAIHPSLVPAFCGKGFYGQHVHEAVLEYGVKITGCTVHLVDNDYDHGPVVLQSPVPVLEGDTLDSLEARVFAAECEAYPKALQLIAQGRVWVEGRRVRILPGLH